MAKSQTLEEVMKKEVFNIYDICVIFGCGTDKAYKIIKSIRSVSDIIQWGGHCHKKDYEKYISRFEKEKRVASNYHEDYNS